MSSQNNTPTHSRNSSTDLPSVRSFTTPPRPSPQSPAALTTPPPTGEDGSSWPTVPFSGTPILTVNLHPTDSPSRAIGLPHILPAPITGSEDMVAGPWAKFITVAPFQFSVGVNGVNLKGRLLGRLLTMPAKNEPVLRLGARSGWTATTFFTKINSLLANVEGIVMQCVGDIITDPEKMCEHCRKLTGPFAFCVTVDGVEECANCHWEREEHRCSFNTSPSVPKSRRSSKLYTPEEVEAMEKEVADLRVLKAALVEKSIAMRKLIEGASEHCQGAFDSNPEHADNTPVNGESRLAMDNYNQVLRNQWLWKMDRKVRDLQKTFGVLNDEFFDIINRLEELLP